MGTSDIQKFVSVTYLTVYDFSVYYVLVICSLKVCKETVWIL